MVADDKTNTWDILQFQIAVDGFAPYFFYTMDKGT